MNKWINKIHNGRCEKLIPLLPDNSIDIMITSPPYNVDLGNNKFNTDGYDTYKDNVPYNVYIEWLITVFKLLKPKMVHGGRVCVNIGSKDNGRIPTFSDVIQFMTKELEYLIKGIIVWDKKHTSNRAAWGSWMSPSNPSFPTPVEYILIFCNDSQQKQGLKENITVTRDEFIENSLALWTFPGASKSKHDHPASFPIDLPYRLIQQLSYKNDIVLDIFAGSGTTCLAAEMLGRQWIGMELSSKYTNVAIKRLDDYMNQTKLFVAE